MASDQSKKLDSKKPSPASVQNQAVQPLVTPVVKKKILAKPQPLQTGSKQSDNPFFEGVGETVKNILANQQTPARRGLALKTMISNQTFVPPSQPKHDNTVTPEKFLTSNEKIIDIYIKYHGRLSPKQKRLLESEMLIRWMNMLTLFQENKELMRKQDAKVIANILKWYQNDPDPLLIGFVDKKLSELWKLIVLGWEVWDYENDGVLFYIQGNLDDNENEEDKNDTDENDGNLEQKLIFTEEEIILETIFKPKNENRVHDQIRYDGFDVWREKNIIAKKVIK